MPIHLAADCAVLLAFWWMLMRTSKQFRTELRTEVDRLSNTIRALEESTNKASGNGDLTKVANIRIIPSTLTEQLTGSPGSNHEHSQISPETEEAIKATLSAFLGQKVQIRSVKLVEEPELAATWVTQGRIAIQASHNQFASRV